MDNQPQTAMFLGMDVLSPYMFWVNYTTAKIPKKLPTNWEEYIHKLCRTGHSKKMAVCKGDPFYEEVANLTPGDLFTVQNRETIIKPTKAVPAPQQITTIPEIVNILNKRAY